MKTRLFWKILLAFWLTFVAITQGVWLLFELRRDDRSPPERFMVEQMGPALLAAGEHSFTQSGLTGFDTFSRSLPADQRARLELLANGQPSRLPEAGFDRALSRGVTAPDGRTAELRYGYHVETRPATILNVPPELLALGLVGGLIFAAVLAGYLTRPINQLRAGFDRLAQGRFSERLAPVMGNRRDEIADLARDFDLMAQRLEHLVAGRERLLHDVSHELRSPLARLQLAIGLARQSPARIDVSLDRIEHEAGRLDTLVGELLTLARAEHLASEAEEYFDLAGVLHSVIDDARFEAEAASVAIALTEDVPADRDPVRGHAEMMRRAIDNVIRNAVRFSSAGQTVRVAIAHDPARPLYRIAIADDGPGVAESEIASMFDPFVRASSDGAGFGLGLTIASRALAVHQGEIRASRGSSGGLVVTMEIPTIEQRA